MSEQTTSVPTPVVGQQSWQAPLDDGSGRGGAGR